VSAAPTDRVPAGSGIPADRILGAGQVESSAEAMDIRGSRTLDAPRAAVFAAILDPGTLLSVIPGCREIEQVDDSEYRGTISLRLPGVVGTYRTVVRMIEADAPSFGLLQGEVVGTLGSIRGTASFRLADADGSTTVDYQGRAAIDGPLARLDGRFVESLAGSLIEQGLDRLDERLRDERTAAATPGRPA
jgi:carbon monoxide dehydrogenase subunit G